MAITIRPTDNELELVQYAKRVTGEKTASKALIKLCESHQELSAKLDKAEKSNIHYRSRANKAESVLCRFKGSLHEITQFEVNA